MNIFREVMVLITGANKSIALYKAVEEGVCHMWTVSAFQMHNNTLMVCDEDATLELRVRTVKYFKVRNLFTLYKRSISFQTTEIKLHASLSCSVCAKIYYLHHLCICCRTCGMFTQVSMKRFLRKK